MGVSRVTEAHWPVTETVTRAAQRPKMPKHFTNASDNSFALAARPPVVRFPSRRPPTLFALPSLMEYIYAKLSRSDLLTLTTGRLPVRTVPTAASV